MQISRGDTPRKKIGRGVRPASQNPYHIYDQNLQFSLPYLWPDQKLDTLFRKAKRVWKERDMVKK